MSNHYYVNGCKFTHFTSVWTVGKYHHFYLNNCRGSLKLYQNSYTAEFYLEQKTIKIFLSLYWSLEYLSLASFLCFSSTFICDTKPLPAKYTHRLYTVKQIYLVCIKLSVRLKHVSQDTPYGLTHDTKSATNLILLGQKYKWNMFKTGRGRPPWLQTLFELAQPFCQKRIYIYIFDTWDVTHDTWNLNLTNDMWHMVGG